MNNFLFKYSRGIKDGYYAVVCGYDYEYEAKERLIKELELNYFDTVELIQMVDYIINENSY